MAFGSPSIKEVSDPRPKLLHVIDSLNMGGTEKQCVELVRRIDQEKFTVCLATFNKNGPLLDEITASGIPLKEFEISGGFYHPKSLIQIFKLASFMRKAGFDIVQTYGFYSTVPGVIAAKLARVPVIIAAKRELSEMLSRRKMNLEKFLWNFCAAIVVNADRIKEHLRDYEGMTKKKIITIYNGVDLNGYPDVRRDEYLSRPDTVGMVANFRDQKDHQTFLEAASLVLREKPGVRFFLVGTGPLEEEMKKYAKDLGIGRSVTFHGRKIGRELYEIVNQFTISVLVATNEGTPNAVLEAMALALPVVANPSGGIPEAVEDSVTGFLVPYKKPEILKNKLLYLIQHKEAARRMGETGRKKAEEKYNYDLMCSKYEELYEEVLGKQNICRRTGSRLLD